MKDMSSPSVLPLLSRTPEELSLRVLLSHHFRFRPPAVRPVPDGSACHVDAGQGSGCPRQVFFSSGMKQRVKWDWHCWWMPRSSLLDEPLTNLDDRGREWYDDMIHSWAVDRTVIVASNRKDEYVFCKTELDIRDFCRG